MFEIYPRLNQTWLICGGRNFTDNNLFGSAMRDFCNARGGVPSLVVHGAARGADTFAADWARRLAIDVVAVPADWEKHGKAAGVLRNQKMLDEHRPDFVVAFPGGRGTADMVARARRIGIDVGEVWPGEAQCR